MSSEATRIGIIRCDCYSFNFLAIRGRRGHPFAICQCISSFAIPYFSVHYREDHVKHTFPACACLALALTTSANAGEKITGVDKDIQVLSDVTAAVPDQPGHLLRQLTIIYKVTTSSARYGDVLVTSTEQQDIIGAESTFRGYGTAHHTDGEVTYFSYEGAGKATAPREGGAVDVASQAKFTWTGGTGKQNVKGPGTVTCKLTIRPGASQVGGQCDWHGEVE